MLKAEEAQQKI